MDKVLVEHLIEEVLKVVVGVDSSVCSLGQE